jgi:hypothetical protein
MKLHFSRRLAAVAFALLAAAPAGSLAAVVTVSELAAPDDVHSTREVILTGPPPFKTFIDRLSVAAPPVTLSGGDVLDFHLALQPPYRFAISPTANAFTVGVEMRTSASGTPSAHAGDPPAVVLLAPENERQPGPASTRYETDQASGRVLSLVAEQLYGVLPPAAAFDPFSPTTFSGFDGTLALPAEFPTTLFDGGVSLVVTAQLDRGVDPPPVLAYVTTVPEPAGLLALAGAIGAIGAGIGRRHRPRV